VQETSTPGQEKPICFDSVSNCTAVEEKNSLNLQLYHSASGVTILEPQKIIYLLANEKEKGAPIDHELMHMITLADWGNPDRTSLWMNEGLAAFSQNICNGYNDEQIYRYFAASRMLLPIDSLVNQFYSFQPIYGVTFSDVVRDIDITAKRDYPMAPDIVWKKFSEECY